MFLVTLDSVCYRTIENLSGHVRSRLNRGTFRRRFFTSGRENEALSQATQGQRTAPAVLAHPRSCYELFPSFWGVSTSVMSILQVACGKELRSLVNLVAGRLTVPNIESRCNQLKLGHPRRGSHHKIGLASLTVVIGLFRIHLVVAAWPFNRSAESLQRFSTLPAIWLHFWYASTASL